MTLPTITGEFRVVGEPTLKFVGNDNKPVATIRVVASRSVKNQSGEWEKKAEIWANAEAWDDHAQAVAAVVKDKDIVSITGQLETREYDRKDGGKGSSNEIRFAKIAVVPPRLNQGQGSNQQQPNSGGWGSAPAQTNPAADPWSSAPAAGDQLPPF